MLVQLFKLLTFETLVLFVATQHGSDSNVCTSERCSQTAMMFLKNMDSGMLPCHNFYDFMCKKFPKTHSLRPGYGRESAFTIRERYVDEKLLALFNSEEDDFPIIRKVRTVYQNCMDEATIEELGLSTVPLELNSIGLPMTLPLNPAPIESGDVSRLLARLHRHASYAKFLFQASMYTDFDDPRENHLQIQNSPAINQFWNDEWSKIPEVLGIRSRVTSQEEETKKVKEEKLMKEAVLYMCDLTNERYSEKAKKLIENRIEQVVDFLEKLRKTKELQDLYSDPARITVVELQKKTDEILGGDNSQIKINWLDYLEKLFENIRDDARQMFEGGEIILIANMKQFEAVLRILATVDQKVFLSAMWWIVMRSVSSFASKELRRIYYDFEVQVQQGSISPRQSRCLNVVQNKFPFILGVILVSADKNAVEDQNKAFEMLDNLKKAFHDTIVNSKWLDSSTKMATLNKLSKIRQSISFENWMLNLSEIESLYSDRIVIPGQHFTTMKLMVRTSRERNFSCLGRSNDIFSGIPSPNPGDVNAYYAYQNNGILLPIGILGPPFYGLGLEALNYGAIGVVIGHELGHAFDSAGKNYNSLGMKKVWWKKRTNAEYGRRADCFIKSYNNIFIPAAKRCVDGKLTINENIADYLGFTQAVKAYRMYVQKHGQEKLLPHFEHYSHEKLLTMAFANIYCELSTPGFSKWQLENDVHSPGPARVLGVLGNSVEFAKIWKCSNESQMNLPKKCKLW